MEINIEPNDSGLPGIAQLRDIVGAVMTVGLILSVLALIVSAIVWGLGANSSNPHLASRGKTGVLVWCGAAAPCGAGVSWISFFWTVGQAVAWAVILGEYLRHPRQLHRLPGDRRRTRRPVLRLDRLRDGIGRVLPVPGHVGSVLH